MSPSTNRAEAAIYLAAAKAIGAGREEYSCIAIDNAIDPLECGTPQRRKYSNIFGANLQTKIYTACDGVDNYECKQLRILLLCFMAAMVEAGDA